jgi:hypothetical protein
VPFECSGDGVGEGEGRDSVEHDTGVALCSDKAAKGRWSLAARLDELCRPLVIGFIVWKWCECVTGPCVRGS